MQTIIVRMPNWIGDCVMATPVLSDLRLAFPQAKITLMCKKSLAPLFFENPFIDELFAFSLPKSFFRRSSHRQLVERIRQGKYDLGLLLPNSFSSAWWFYRGKVKRRVGFKTDGRSLLLTDRIPLPDEKGKEHLVTTYKRILQPLGIPISQTPPSLFLSSKEREDIEHFLDQIKIPKNSFLLGINPTAAFGSAKCWPAENFALLSQKLLLHHPNLVLLFFGDAKAHALCTSITKDLGAKEAPRAINLAGRTTLRELILLIEKCNLFLTNDSGPMHIAAALNRPLIALFGSTNEIATGPYLPPKHEKLTLIHKHLPCSPCYKRVCPIDFRCMKNISVEEVYQEVTKYFN